MLIIGDVHGKINDYWKTLQKHEGNSIQVGDFGFRHHHEWHLKNIDPNKHKINFGNHDDYSFLNERHSLGNWNCDELTGIMTIRGAYSIDRYMRVEGKDWWSNEEMNYSEWRECAEVYERFKPKIVVSHDCPRFITKYMFGYDSKNITNQGLHQLYELHQPDLWLFGHHHRSVDTIIEKTKFICLAELETFLI